MSNFNIPLRPSRKGYGLSEQEKNCLTWYVLSGCKRDEAYMIFVRPDLAISKKNLSSATNQFFASMNVRDYLTDYKRLLTNGISLDDEQVDVDIEIRKARARDNFTDKVIEKMEGNMSSIDEMESVAKMADRVGMFGEESKADIAPIRFLPARCKSECRYRLFVEGMKAESKIFDDCDYCRARKFAVDKGFQYDPCTLLDVPQEVIDEIDSKNEVKLSDILSGRINN